MINTCITSWIFNCTEVNDNVNKRRMEITLFFASYNEQYAYIIRSVSIRSRKSNHLKSRVLRESIIIITYTRISTSLIEIHGTISQWHADFALPASSD